MKKGGGVDSDKNAAALAARESGRERARSQIQPFKKQKVSCKLSALRC